MLVVAEFTTISYRTIGIGACSDRSGPGVCKTVGHDSHGFALLILAPLALLLTWAAVVGRSRGAAMSLVGVALAVLVIALAIDLPKLDDRRGLDTFYDDVVGHTGDAFRLELVGGVLLLLVGGLALGRPGPGAAPRRRREREVVASGEPPVDATGEPVAPGEPGADEPFPNPEQYRPQPVGDEEEPEAGISDAERRRRARARAKQKARGKGAAKPRRQRRRRPPSE